MSKDYIAIASVFAAISVIIAIDITYDTLSGGSVGHVFFEGLVFIMSLSGVFLVIRENIAVKKRNVKLLIDLEQSEKEYALWRSEAEKHLKGLGEVIDKQMSRWSLTPAEKEVGLLLLKGFSFKEIAAVRETSERTARQQSLEIYKKSGLSGRAEFSAFFLEDLLLPEIEDSA
ncbi:transcriptional regulator, LuxR family [hydrothermal vent metagenome]|uniref:Transcriptional regulator, LuxR family n=1 Tax=hydrothermal vent metagenome TaxID=652676 RepID=A0A3B1C0P5_9ZZZZ